MTNLERHEPGLSDEVGLASSVFDVLEEDESPFRMLVKSPASPPLSEVVWALLEVGSFVGVVVFGSSVEDGVDEVGCEVGWSTTMEFGSVEGVAEVVGSWLAVV
jgi:hypothetical protein